MKFLGKSLSESTCLALGGGGLGFRGLGFKGLRSGGLGGL